MTTFLLLVAALVRWWMTPWLGHEVPFGLFVPVLVLGGFLWGWSSALWSTAAGLALGSIFAAGDPDGNAPALTSGALYLAVGLMVTMTTWILGSANRKAAEATRQAIEAHRHKDRFLAVLGHELRNPLNSIALGAEMLLRKSASDPGVASVVQMVLRQSRHMQQLINELLDIHRIEQGKVELSLGQVVLQDVVKAGLEQQQAAIEQRGQTLTQVLSPRPVLIQGDHGRLVQVVSNLLANASKHSGPQTTIEVHLSEVNKEAVLLVKDNGRGIPTEKLPFLFEPFLQVGPSRNDPEEGLGLGLPVVKRLVELHQGTVLAFSAGPGCGAVFAVRLPLLRQPQATKRPALATAAA